ncbi:hypothetical protein SLNWT_5255 [Streptomyces albus]|uniref:Uncharacterized protein n=1 Tax=Streptomyces albus (strain ATCC 21838 / DSM 41398 / FERM P-419 / JCM 4703 / NBRC 107858) TaxID=1081613 RepID=A0A0B5F3Y8_STRA4|nr:hypothetical protein SLNWT_5255 [Streptomyces albus]AOU79933.1 hypothetical protein SLNHY_5242 [Streptomyces albus]AYN35651.1 hypothetical protein DUI70_5153 [Streptomyces albus]
MHGCALSPVPPGGDGGAHRGPPRLRPRPKASDVPDAASIT